MSWYLICEAHCELPTDNRKSESVEKSVSWSTQDCNNALRMAIMHKLSLRWLSRKRKPQTHRHGMKYAAFTAHVLSTTPACELFWRTRLSRLLRECFGISLLRIAPVCAPLCASQIKTLCASLIKTWYPDNKLDCHTSEVPTEFTEVLGGHLG